MKVTFLGLGVMGFPMAGHLKRNGHEVTVYNRTGTKAAKWAETHGGASAPTPALAVKGALFVDHTTASAEVAREIDAAARDAGLGFLDAPVSGGQAGAENGKLTVMVGGAPKDFDRAKPVIDSYARACELMGPAGSGQLAKMVNQICIAGLVQALAEGMHFAQKAGLDGAKLLDVISKGAAQSWQMENRGLTMLQGKFDFGFAVDWMRKDLGICLTEAKRNGAQLPVTALVDQFYARIQKRGGGRWDTSSLMQPLSEP
jgi:3-hydroxyisobutyrate dehydrogenase-like beta-hydroxyacid dehydrogenase